MGFGDRDNESREISGVVGDPKKPQKAPKCCISIRARFFVSGNQSHRVAEFSVDLISRNVHQLGTRKSLQNQNSLLLFITILVFY